jgi:hypothetical protein
MYAGTMPDMAAVAHIDHDGLVVRTESDVEQKVLMPLLNGEAYLAIPETQIHTKEYLAPTKLDKTAGKTTGYFPDYSVWSCGFAIMIVEAKAPGVPTDEGYREASLYARHLNQNYPTGLNPCRFVIASDGDVLQFGYWDAQPELSVKVADLRPGSATLQELRQLCGIRVLDGHAQECLRHIRSRAIQFPADLADGQALLNAKLPLNSFAADLSPILRKYFSNQEDVHEIALRAYVNSAEVTEYDRVLESLLKERLKVQRDTIVLPLRPGKKGEETIARAISDFDKARPERGHLQIVQGAVGSGKSLFMNRYYHVLQPKEDTKRTRWAFIDFNAAPPDLSTAYEWLCLKFVEDFQHRNPGLDLFSLQSLRGVFARNIQKRKGIYEARRKASSQEEETAKANDLNQWQDNPKEFARGIAEYVMGSRHEIWL